MQIVPFSAELEAEVIDLIVGIQRGEFGIDIDADRQPDLRSIPAFYQLGAGNFWVARVDERVVGTISLLDIGQGQGALRKMFVHPEFRGPEIGAARSLLGALLEWAGEHSIHDVFLGTTAVFRAAHRFYEKNGFVEIPKLGLPPTFPIMDVDTRFYHLRLPGHDASRGAWVGAFGSRQRITAETYDAIAAAYLEKTRDFARGRVWVERFAAMVPAGGLVADIGSGPGRDTAQLRAHGLDAFSIDLSMGMLRAGRAEYPARRIQASMLSMPLRSRCLDGAWANASVLHLSPLELGTALREIHRVLARSGHLHLTLKRGEGAEWDDSRYGRPRWFQYWSGAELDRELLAASLEPVFSSEEQSSTATWLVRLCRAR